MIILQLYLTNINRIYCFEKKMIGLFRFKCILKNVFYSISLRTVRNMKLITHNMLTSNALKGVKEGFPLKIIPEEVKVVEIEFQQEFITRMLGKLNWNALLYGAKCIGHDEDLPEILPPNYEEDDDLLKKIHHILFEVEVITGNLECPETRRKFPITNGIPNMLLNEDEV